MSIDLLHAGPMFIAAFCIAAVALFIALITAEPQSPRTWLITGMASLVDFLTSAWREGKCSRQAGAGQCSVRVPRSSWPDSGSAN